MQTAKQFLMLASVALLMLDLSAALPTRRRSTSETTEEETPQLQRRRIARKIGGLNVTSTPVQYMRSLYEESYELENEKTRQTAGKPTDVWCFPDRDIAKESYREKPIRNAKCTTYTQYMFQWSSVEDQIESRLLDVESSMLRTYVQIISRHIEEGTSVDVNITVFMVPRQNFSSNSSVNSTDLSEAVIAGQQVLTVRSGSDGWAEFNITEGTREIWPLIPTYTEVQVIIKAEVNCAEQKKVPLSFVNPAEIPLEQENRRARHMDFQPLFVVFANNRETQAVLNTPEDSATGAGNNDSMYRDLGEALFGDREKRSAGDECSIERYVVNLHDLGLTYILAPMTLNISKCAGNCNNRNTINRLGTNHAKIMTAIYNAEVNTVPSVEITATPPCCIPTEYKVVYFLMTPLDGTAAGLKSHNHIVATKCGCR
jgi:hypothetical protein